MKKIIEVDRLVRQFGDRCALNGVTYEVYEGEVFALLGPNGAGKTTTVRLLNGVLEPTSGSMRVLGMEPVSQGCELRRNTGVLTETPSLYERLSARENLSIFGALYGVQERTLAKRVDELLDQFDLTARASDRVGGFSKGMKQRLALARALLHDPQLLFLDEPTAGLDPEAAHQVTELIEQLSHQKGRTVILCTHNLAEAQRLCDRVAVMHTGNILAAGTIDELAASLWTGHSVTIRFEPGLAPQAFGQLSCMPGVKDIRRNDGEATVDVENPSRVPDLVTSLVMSGARILEVQPHQHTLEEIYFTLQNRQKER